MLFITTRPARSVSVPLLETGFRGVEWPEWGVVDLLLALDDGGMTMSRREAAIGVVGVDPSL